MLPEAARKAGVQNTVKLPKAMLRRIIRVTNTRSERATDLILSNVAPSILSYVAASNVAIASLSDGLSVEMDADDGMVEVIKELTRLDVVFFYLKRLKLPVGMKKEYMRLMIAEIVKRSIEEMVKKDKQKSLIGVSGEISKRLEGIVSRGRSQVKKGEPLTEVEAPVRASKLGTQRGKKERTKFSNVPRDGGF